MLLRELYEILLKYPKSNKRDLLALLEEEGWEELTTRDLNRVLYSYRSLFKHGGESLPLWTAKTVPNDFWDLISPKEEQYSVSNFYKGPKPFAWQIEAYEQWVQAGRRGVIEAVTGTGKTMVGIIAATDAASRGLKTLVIVPTIDLLNQWFEKFQQNTKRLILGKLGGGNKDSFQYCDILISTVQTASKHPVSLNGSHGLVIADEVHHIGAETYHKALTEEFQERLGLTATYEREDNNLDLYLSPYFRPTVNNLLFNGFNEVVAGCTYARGLADNILAHFRVCLIPVEFFLEDWEDYEYYDNKASQLRYRLIHVHGCRDAPFGEYMKDVNLLSKGNNNNREATDDARAYLNCFSKRRKLLAENENKLEAIMVLASVLKASSNALIFTETTESAENIESVLTAMGIKAREFSNRLKKDERKARLNEFKDRKIKVLVSPKLLDEGIDVPEADVGVIISASRSQRQMIQRMGRIIRPKKDGRHATFFIIYVKDTYEDPALGAHEAFLTEMKDNADEIKYFTSKAKEKDLFKWYSKKF
jgi:superfamily II DNA or RNA helicase